MVVPSAFETLWMSLLDRLGPMWFAALGTFFFHEVFYFGSHIFWALCDFVPSFKKYKLQPNVENTADRQLRCIKLVLFNHICVQLPMMLAVEPIFQLNMLPPFPSIGKIAWVCFASLVLEDFYFYLVHRLLHWGPFYKHIHKLHHDYSAPLGIAAEYAHPIETVFLGVGSLLGPIFVADHLLSVWIWLGLRLFQTVEVHAGYSFPWSLHNWVPFWGGAKFHDYHHERFTGNYASTFIVWDYIFGTDAGFRKREEQRAKQKSKRSVSLR